MSKVAIITQEQARQLTGKEFASASHYNPVQDCNSNWIISVEEIEQTTNPNYMWVKELPLIEFCPEIFNIEGL